MSSAPRYHHLDALRATAMLLGIVMHGFLSFFENSYWPVQDLQQHELYETANHAIHGFRMPLFFLISGSGEASPNCSCIACSASSCPS